MGETFKVEQKKQDSKNELSNRLDYYDVETALYVTAGALSGGILVLFIMTSVLFSKVAGLKKEIQELQANRLRVQKLKLGQPDKDYAFHNPNLVPDEELTKRGYSMYRADEDLESGRGRQTGGLVEDLNREIESRQAKNSTAPPFLLQGIEENKRKSRTINNPVVGRGRASDTNPNFIY